MKNLFNKLRDKSKGETSGQSFRFIIVGTIATAIQYLIYYIMLQKFNATISFAGGYAVSFIANYFLTTYFTFKTSPSLKKTVRFALTHVFNFVFQALCLRMFIALGVPEVFALFPVYAICIPVNFLLVRLAVMGRKSRKTVVNE